MFDFGIGELLVIGVVALIIIGPKELPGVFRTMGRFTGKVRRMAREFSRAMEDAADEAGVKDIAKTVKGAANPSKFGLDKLNEAADKFDKWDPTKPSEAAKEIGEETAKLSEERAEAARKIHEYSAKKTQARLDAEKAAAETPEPETPKAKDAS
jgi:sec-independent protein translocase protein TatB